MYHSIFHFTWDIYEPKLFTYAVQCKNKQNHSTKFIKEKFLSKSKTNVVATVYFFSVLSTFLNVGRRLRLYVISKSAIQKQKLAIVFIKCSMLSTQDMYHLQWKKIKDRYFGFIPSLQTIRIHGGQQLKQQFRDSP